MLSRAQVEKMLAAYAGFLICRYHKTARVSAARTSHRKHVLSLDGAAQFQMKGYYLGVEISICIIRTPDREEFLRLESM